MAEYIELLIDKYIKGYHMFVDTYGNAFLNRFQSTSSKSIR